jgi:hypothetical protein
MCGCNMLQLENEVKVNDILKYFNNNIYSINYAYCVFITFNDNLKY